MHENDQQEDKNYANQKLPIISTLVLKIITASGVHCVSLVQRIRNGKNLSNSKTAKQQQQSSSTQAQFKTHRSTDVRSELYPAADGTRDEPTWDMRLAVLLERIISSSPSWFSESKHKAAEKSRHKRFRKLQRISKKNLSFVISKSNVLEQIGPLAKQKFNELRLINREHTWVPLKYTKINIGRATIGANRLLNSSSECESS